MRLLLLGFPNLSKHEALSAKNHNLMDTRKFCLPELWELEGCSSEVVGLERLRFAKLNRKQPSVA